MRIWGHLWTLGHKWNWICERPNTRNTLNVSKWCHVIWILKVSMVFLGKEPGRKQEKYGQWDECLVNTKKKKSILYSIMSTNEYILLLSENTLGRWRKTKECPCLTKGSKTYKVMEACCLYMFEHTYWTRQVWASMGIWLNRKTAALLLSKHNYF